MNILQEIFSNAKFATLKEKTWELYLIILSGDYYVEDGKIISEFTQKKLMEYCEVSQATISTRIKDLIGADLIEVQKRYGKDAAIILGTAKKSGNEFLFSSQLSQNVGKTTNAKDVLDKGKYIKTKTNYHYKIENLYTDLENAYGRKFGKIKKIGKYQNGIKSLYTFENKDKDRIISVFKFYLHNFYLYKTIMGYPNYGVFIGFYDVISRDYDLYTKEPDRVIFIEDLIATTENKFNQSFQDPKNKLELVRDFNAFLDSCTFSLTSLKEIFEFYLESYLNPDLRFIKGLPNLSKFFKFFSPIHALYLDRNGGLNTEYNIEEEAVKPKTEAEIKAEEKERAKRKRLEELAALVDDDPYGQY